MPQSLSGHVPYLCNNPAASTYTLPACVSHFCFYLLLKINREDMQTDLKDIVVSFTYQYQFRRITFAARLP